MYLLGWYLFVLPMLNACLFASVKDKVLTGYVKSTSMRTETTVVAGGETLLLRKKDKNKAEQPAATDSCFGLVGPHQLDTAGR